MQQRGVKKTGFRTPEMAKLVAGDSPDSKDYPVQPNTVDPRKIVVELDQVVPKDVYAQIRALPVRRRSTPPRGKNQGRNRLKLVELLLEVSRKMASFDSLDDVLHALVEMTTAEVDGERGSLFLNDSATGELYSRVAQGNIKREIRLLNTTGVAGHVFTSGESAIIWSKAIGKNVAPGLNWVTRS